MSVLLVSVLLAGCGGASGDPATAASPVSAGPTSSPAGAESDLVDVGGHELYLRCTGEGSPTVVYVHGWAQDRSFTPHESARGLRDALDEDFRVCLYDRRNVGSSERVDGVQTPADVLRDMEAVLEQGGVEPPYVLVAASFGGLLAYDFLNHHPDQVDGLVLLDAMFPDELALDRYLPEDATFAHFREDDACCTVERLPQYDLIESLQQYIGREPAVPMVYLASAREPRDDHGSPEYDRQLVASRAAFVDRFRPGRLELVDAPHFMEPVIPDRIAQAVRDVVELARSSPGG